MDVEKPKSTNASSLEELCCHSISENVALYTPEMLEELNQPCLKKLAYNFSLYDIFRFESLLKKRGIDTTHVINTLQYDHLHSTDVYPMKSTTLPHLLRVTTEDGWDSALSRLLYRRVFTRVLDEHGTMMRSGEKHDDFLANLLDKNSDLKQLFLPRHILANDDSVSQSIDLSHDDMIKFCAMAALKTLFVLIDLNFCDFISDSKSKDIFEALCKSVGSISLLIRSNTLVLDVLDKFRTESNCLDRICLYCLKGSDMKYFDEVMSKLSGVAGYYETNLGTKEKVMITQKHFSQEDVDKVNSDRCEEFRLAKCRALWSNEKLSLVEGGVGKMESAPLSRRNSQQQMEADLQEDDLMDDAILGLQLPNEDDSYNGVSSLIFKTTNLVTKDLYVSVIDHHFKHWLSLTQLDFGAPFLDLRMSESIGVLIKRQTFKSLAISSAEISYEAVDEILTCVATFRKSVPLTEIMLLSLQQSASIMENLKNNRVCGRNEAETLAYIEECYSRNLGRLGTFKGTKAFEVSGCSLDIQTQCLLRQYLIADGAIEQMFVSGSIERMFFRSTIKELAQFDRPLTHLVVEDCCLFSQEDCMALTCYLESIANTLVSLSLKSSFCFRDATTFKAATQAIAGCSYLKSLDVSNNNLAANTCIFIKMIYRSYRLKEINLRNNSVTYDSVVSLICLFCRIANTRSPTLDIFDVRGNSFIIEDMPQYKETLARAAKWFICDECHTT